MYNYMYMTDSMNIKKGFYEREEKLLSPYATLSSSTKGRALPIPEDSLRTEFMRDRDRIIHCKSFRRMKDKTQVFISPRGSHYRTRLTHTLEVAQIARTISRCLNLNEDLTEAIALGHDLGHTPFGHAGERALADFFRETGSPLTFEHNAQSLRIVEKLENNKGLNLTFEVRDGIYNHKKDMHPATLEARAVSFADRIAYLNHDIDDALRARIITADELPGEAIAVLGDNYSRRINTMITDIVRESYDQPALHMSGAVSQATEVLREYMFRAVYKDNAAKEEEKKVKDLIFMLMDYYMTHPEALKKEGVRYIEEDGALTAAADYVSGMTDGFAVMKFKELFVPESWTLL